MGNDSGGNEAMVRSEDIRFNQVERYNALLSIVLERKTVRAFANYEVPPQHYEMILEAARHAPSGANAQPWHFIVVTDPEIKEQLGEAFVREQLHRARLGMKFPTPNYKGMKTAPGLIVVGGDFRFIRAFPVLNDDSETDRIYKLNAERILVQSIAASTMLAHLAAAALCYSVWWVSAIGQEEIQKEFKPLLGVPEEIALVDIMCFGPSLNPPYKRWKKRLDQIMSLERFDMGNFLTSEQVGQWIKDERARAMYRDESHVD
jgi:nitroreductase